MIIEKRPVQDTTITFKTASLARQIGFIISCVGSHVYPYYKKDGERGDTSTTHLYLNAPVACPQSVLSSWLRKYYGINVCVEPSFDCYVYQVLEFDKDSTENSYINEASEFVDWESYEEAFEKGLQEALNYLIEKQKDERNSNVPVS